MSNNNGNNSGFTNAPTWTEIGLRKTAIVNQEVSSIQAARLSLANQTAQQNHQVQQNLQQQLQQSENANQYYKALLCKPLAEIAAQHSQFKEAYDAQQLIIADWMVSQKAYKELAIQFGAQLGKSKDEVFSEGLAKKIDVLKDRHNPDHFTNAKDKELIVEKKEIIKAKL
jgi:hypothetical protein